LASRSNGELELYELSPRVEPWIQQQYKVRKNSMAPRMDTNAAAFQRLSLSRPLFTRIDFMLAIFSAANVALKISGDNKNAKFLPFE